MREWLPPTPFFHHHNDLTHPKRHFLRHPQDIFESIAEVPKNLQGFHMNVPILSPQSHWHMQLLKVYSLFFGNNFLKWDKEDYWKVLRSTAQQCDCT